MRRSGMSLVDLVVLVGLTSSVFIAFSSLLTQGTRTLNSGAEKLTSRYSLALSIYQMKRYLRAATSCTKLTTGSGGIQCNGDFAGTGLVKTVRFYIQYAGTSNSSLVMAERVAPAPFQVAWKRKGITSVVVCNDDDMAGIGGGTCALPGTKLNQTHIAYLGPPGSRRRGRFFRIQLTGQGGTQLNSVVTSVFVRNGAASGFAYEVGG